MDIAIDEVLHFDAVTHVASTGAVSDADSTPSWAIYEEDTDTAVQSGNFTKRTSLTGNYRASVTLSAANGFEAGKWYNVIASATVSSVAGKAVVMRFRCVPAESSAGVPKIDVSHFGGTAGTFSGGRPEVNTTHAAGTAWGSGAITAASLATGAITAAKFGAGAVDAAALATDAVQEIRDAITGGAYALSTDANGRIRIVDGTGTGELDTSSGTVTAGTVSDKTGYRLSATGVDDIWDEAISGHLTAGSTGNALNSAGSAGDPWGTSLPGAYGAGSAGYILGTYLTAAPPTAAAIADAVCDEALSGHQTAGTLSKYIIDINAALVSRTGATVNDAAATTTSFKTTLTEADDFYNDALLVFTSGALLGQSRTISDYANTNGVITLDEALTSAPANGVSFIIKSDHIHPASQIAAAVWANATRTLTALGFALGASDLASGIITSAKFATGAIDAAATSADFVSEIRAAITGGAYALDTDANGRIRIVDGTGTGEIDTSSGLVSVVASAVRAAIGMSAANLDTQLAAIVEDTGTTLPAQISGLNNLSAAQVNAEVVDALSTDTYAEPGQGAPGATVSLATKIGYLYKAWRNKKTQTSTTLSIFADDASTVDHKATVSDDGTTTTIGELVSGP